ncbi:PQQ-dependent dehydrogenase, methanol/ethanol family [Pontibacter sp. JAM-7]|uniref:PQQ-dependent dehydrogenase, methanol/ethanol family n=1 Tax=Pontibacter sp. JAM-7 TaxID=3366581 RepID=UPI003AF50AC3
MSFAKRFGALTVAVAVAPAAFAVGGGVAAKSNPLEKYSPVTEERLTNPEPENWLQWRGNYEGWSYSPLDQINADNVDDLVPVWSFSTGELEGHQAPPIVNDGVMFISTPNNKVIALNAETGDELWSFKKEIPEELFQLHPTNRGVGLYGDMVYLAATDACLVALNAKTGEQAWETCVADWQDGYYMTLSPLIAKGKVMVGVSGGEYGIRGHITAVDAKTGEIAWKTHTIPAPGEPGSETWKGDAWKTGGASVWIAGTYDADMGVAFYGTGNGGPWMPDTRPGDNLYANSVVALDVETGELKGYHQYHWNDAWDWDEVSPPVIIDYEHKGKKIKGLVHAGRNGYLWTLERNKDGSIDFVDAEAYVKQNVFKSIDPKTGRPTYDPAHTPGTGKAVTFCPSLWGGKDWPPESYNPKTGLFYIPAHENLCSEMGGVELGPRKSGELYIGVPIADILTNIRLAEGAEDHIGEIQAWDLKSGKKVWQFNMKEMNWGPLLSTGGNLVFSGGSNDRVFRALDARTGKKLWQYRANSGITAVPSSWKVNGTQFIGVQAGWGVDAQRMQGAFDAVMDHTTVVPQGGVLHVFALKSKADKLIEAATQ